MPASLPRRPFGRTGIEVSPLGLSATYRPGPKTVRVAAEEGINLFFAFGIDTQMSAALREIMPARREQFVLATGAYNYIWRAQDIRKTFEKRLRQFNTDYIDFFLFLGVTKPAEFPQKVRDELRLLREEGKVRAIGLSCHHRHFLGELAESGEMDALMLRYNAAHRGAEQDIFPHLAAHNPGVLGYTATRWGYLLRRPRTLPKGARVPTAGECYRFVLSNPHIHSVLTSPRSERELRENIAAVRQGPLNEEDLAFMRTFGDVVHNQKRWFM